MVTLPVIRPLTRPEVAWMVAIAGLLLLHVPPGVAHDSVVVLPMQTEELPVIGDMGAVTVNDAYTLQPPKE